MAFQVTMNPVGLGVPMKSVPFSGLVCIKGRELGRSATSKLQSALDDLQMGDVMIRKEGHDTVVSSGKDKEALGDLLGALDFLKQRHPDGSGYYRNVAYTPEERPAGDHWPVLQPFVKREGLEHVVKDIAYANLLKTAVPIKDEEYTDEETEKPKISLLAEVIDAGLNTEDGPTLAAQLTARTAATNIATQLPASFEAGRLVPELETVYKTVPFTKR